MPLPTCCRPDHEEGYKKTLIFPGHGDEDDEENRTWLSRKSFQVVAEKLEHGQSGISEGFKKEVQAAMAEQWANIEEILKELQGTNAQLLGQQEELLAPVVDRIDGMIEIMRNDKEQAKEKQANKELMAKMAATGELKSARQIVLNGDVQFARQNMVNGGKGAMPPFDLDEEERKGSKRGTSPAGEGEKDDKSLEATTMPSVVGTARKSMIGSMVSQLSKPKKKNKKKSEKGGKEDGEKEEEFNKLYLAGVPEESKMYVAPERNLLEEHVAKAFKKYRFPEDSKDFLCQLDGPGSFLVRSWQFKFGINLLIFANVTFIGLQAQHAIDVARVGEEPANSYTIVDSVFSACFFIEFIGRIFAERLSLFVSIDWKWNMMDMGFVLLDLFVILTAVLVDGDGLAIVASIRGILKGVRLARAARALRLFRAFRNVSGLPTMKLMMSQILFSIGAFVWLAALFGVFLLFFGVIFMQATADSLNGKGGDMKTQAELGHYFGSLPQSWLSLFRSVFGGINWNFLYDAFAEVSSTYSFMFVLYIFFVYISFLNVVAAMFVENALRAASISTDAGKIDACHSIKKFMLTKLAEDERKISNKEFKLILGEPCIQASMKTIGLDVSEALAIFELLDTRGTSTLDVGALVRGCERFTRQSKSADIVAILLTNRKVMAEIRDLQVFITARFQYLSEFITSSLA